MKAIHNILSILLTLKSVVLYLKDTEKWKQFTTLNRRVVKPILLCCISKIQKNESNSQLFFQKPTKQKSCVVSQRYRKMKAIHNSYSRKHYRAAVVLYLKDTEKWKQFTTIVCFNNFRCWLCCISKIQKNESNSQLTN